MTLIKLAGFFLLTTLSFHGIGGKNSALLDTDKDADLKPSEKRVSNFRMNVETPFDPNFWPARGRRGRRDPDKPDDCFSFEDRFGLPCQQERRATKSDMGAGFNDFDIDVERSEGDCYGNPAESKTEGVKRKSAPDSTEAKFSNELSQFTSKKRRRQRIFPLSRFLAYGNGLYYEPENPFGEKTKKQDVFWIVRGKKNYQ